MIETSRVSFFETVTVQERVDPVVDGIIYSSFFELKKGLKSKELFQ